MVWQAIRIVWTIPILMETSSIGTALQNFPELLFGHKNSSCPGGQGYRPDAYARDSIFYLN
jgi:hypothetical protein